MCHSHSWLKKEKVLTLLLFLIIWQRFSSGSSLFAGCTTEWDDIRCWPRAEVGQVANASCAEVFQHFSSNQGWFPIRAWSPNTSFSPSVPQMITQKLHLLLHSCLCVCAVSSATEMQAGVSLIKEHLLEFFMQVLLPRIYFILWKVSVIQSGMQDSQDTVWHYVRLFLFLFFGLNSCSC